MRRSIFILLVLLCPFFVAFADDPLDQAINTLLASGNNGSTVFKLAEFFRKLEDYAQAGYWHKIRLTKEPKDQFEIWFSKWMIGRCSEKQGHIAEAIYWYMEAFNHHPDRPEPFYDLCHLYRMQGANHLSHLFGVTARKIIERLPSNEGFFEGFYPALLDLELSITAFYTPYKEDGLDASDRLVLDQDFPWQWKNDVYKNLIFYVQPIEKIDERQIYAQLPKITPFSSEHYYPLNPSILRTKNGYTMVLRAVNYLQQGAKDFYTEDPEQKFRTKNFLLELDTNFSVQKQVQIVENLPRKKHLGSWVDGLEDCRLVRKNHELWFSCCTTDTNPNLIPQISLCKLEVDLDRDPIFVSTLTPLTAFDPGRCEKNWLPFVRNEEIFFIYSFCPFVVLKPDTSSGRCSVVTNQQLPKNLSNLRGSAAPIAFQNGFLSLTHEVVFMDDETRCYLHRFVYMNRAYVIEKISKPFIFTHFGVEFCCGMTLNHTEDALIIPYGFEDREARICSVAIDTVENMLEDLAE